MTIAQDFLTESINAGMASPGTLTRMIEDSTATESERRATGGSATLTPLTYPFQGFEYTTTVQEPDSLRRSNVATVTIYGASIATTPKTNDIVDIQNHKYRLGRLIESDSDRISYCFIASEYVPPDPSTIPPTPSPPQIFESDVFEDTFA